MRAATTTTAGASGASTTTADAGDTGDGAAGATEAPLDGIEITLTEVATADAPTSLVTRPGSTERCTSPSGRAGSGP